MSVLFIVGPKCTLAASHAFPMVSHVKYAPRALLRLEKEGTDRQADGRTSDRYIALTAKHGWRNNNNLYNTDLCSFIKMSFLYFNFTHYTTKLQDNQP